MLSRTRAGSLTLYSQVKMSEAALFEEHRVAFSDRCRRLKFKKLDWDDLDEATQNAHAKSAVDDAFTAAGVDPRSHPKAREATIKKVKDTRALAATTFTGWDGYAELKTQARALREYQKHYNGIHMLSAPLVMTAVVIKNTPTIWSSGQDEVTQIFRSLDLWDYIILAINVYYMTQNTFHIVFDSGVAGLYNIIDPTAKLPVVKARPPLPSRIRLVDEVAEILALTDAEFRVTLQLQNSAQVTRKVTRTGVFKSGKDLINKIGHPDFPQDRLLCPFALWFSPRVFEVLPMDVKRRCINFCFERYLYGFEGLPALSEPDCTEVEYPVDSKEELVSHFNSLRTKAHFMGDPTIQATIHVSANLMIASINFFDLLETERRKQWSPSVLNFNLVGGFHGHWTSGIRALKHLTAEMETLLP